jgi:DNA-binding NarL/FixJ family response regulator
MDVFVVGSDIGRREWLVRQCRAHGLEVVAELARLDEQRPPVGTDLDVVIIDEEDVLTGALDDVDARDVVVGVFSDEAAVARALVRSGAAGWVMLPASADEADVPALLVAAGQGLVVAPRDVWAGSTGGPTDDGVGAEQLTPRELEVLDLLAEGLSNRLIAARLGTSEHTAKAHVASILGKLAVSTRAGAVAEGVRRGLVRL